MEEIVISMIMVITIIKILMLITIIIMIIILVIMIIMIMTIKITTSKGRISLYNSLYMPYCLFLTNSKTLVTQTPFLIKLTNCNTYLSMQYKSTYPVNGFKGTLTERNYPQC